MKERIEAIKEYLKYFPNDFNAKNNLTLCECLDELGLDIELKGYYYPRVEWDNVIFNSQIRMTSRYSITNSATKYKHDGKNKVIVWNESCGRCAFVDSDYWWDIADEWEELTNVLKSYNPLDYDEINNNYIYNLENGKRLINDYDKIVQDFKDKVDKKIKEVQLENKRKEFERLKRELEEM